MTSPYLEKLTSRFCHDLANPLGAIGNGLELLEMTHGSSDEMTLIRDSLTSATSKLKVFRTAFGVPAASVPQDTVTRTWNAASKLELHLTAQYGCRGDDVKLLYLLLMCTEHLLLRGGRAMVGLGDALTIHATGPKIAEDIGLWADLPSGNVELGEANRMHFVMAADEIRTRKLTLRVDITSDAVEVHCTL